MLAIVAANFTVAVLALGDCSRIGIPFWSLGPTATTHDDVTVVHPLC